MALKTPGPPWWKTNEYTLSEAIPKALSWPSISGPHGMALVPAWDDGTTAPGWGLRSKQGPGFMSLYPQKRFRADRTLRGYEQDAWHFAFIMRAMKVIVIDIDGKNGGIENAPLLLGNAPPTLAETSKSGTGYHLFYETPDTWDLDKGFAMFDDSIGIVKGVDIRDTGCVYHHKQQRWNGLPLAPLPQHIADRLLAKKTRRADEAARLTVISDMDEMEKLMAHEHLLEELAKPIGAGKRNATLYAIGSKLALAGVDKWEDAVQTRAGEVGLGSDEADKIIANIQRYEVPTAP